MSLAARKPSKWTVQVIEEIFTSKRPEGATLDYKAEFPATDGDKNKLEHVVDSFANTQGGQIIIGIDADKTSNAPVAMEGIRDEPGLVERVTSFCQRMTPHIEPSVHRIEKGNGRVFVVVEIAESNECHMASDGKFYVRIGPQSLPADYYTVQRLFKKQDEFREKVTTLLESRRANLQGEGGAWYQIVFLPYGFREGLIPIFDETTGKLNQQTISVMKNVPIFGGGYYANPTQFGYYLYVDDVKGGVRGYVDVSQNGLIELSRRLSFLGEKDPIGTEWVRDLLTRVILYATSLYKHVHYDGTIRLVLHFFNIKGKEIAFSPYQSSFDEQYPYRSDHLVIQRDAKMLELESPARIISSMVAELMRSFGAPP